MDTLDGLKTIIAVVEMGSFTAASERLGISKALASKYVGEVEQALGVRLFNRSTRRLSLTEAGRAYYEQALPLLEGFSALQDEVSGEQSSVRGLLRVSAPLTFGEAFIAPLVPQFRQDFPGIQVDLQLTARVIDMLEEGFDLVIRVGAVEDSNLIAKQVKPIPFVICATPEYLKTANLADTLACLPEHECVLDKNFRTGKQWRLVSADGVVTTLNMKSSVSVDSPRGVKKVVLADGGVAMLPRFVVQSELESGALVELLTDYQKPETGLYVIYPHRRYLAKKTQAFIAFIERKLGG
ncbi:MAG: LysR family transcriptional regulator [Methylococcales bacterium]|jgi:DNA-binding transcriptional LysR family regulator|nr:LysR family transcriptional regulator [Methylococcales bacterium]MBT7442969.1 LysR family transcriptional regulator [Methylococcales bacterium]